MNPATQAGASSRLPFGNPAPTTATGPGDRTGGRPNSYSGTWELIVLVLTVGYLSMGRSFSYLGIPPLYIFVAEVVLALFVLFGPRLGRWRWLSVAARLPRLKTLKRLLYLLLAYGVFQIIHGIFAGYPPLTAIRDFAFDYYPVYFFLGLWVGLREPEGLPKLIRLFAWVNGIYGTAYVLLLNRSTWTIPGVSDQVVPVSVFGSPGYSFLALLGLLAFAKSLRHLWPLLVLNSFVMLGMQARGEWLAFALGLAIWAWRTKQFKRAMWGGAIVSLMLVLMAVSHLRLPGVEARAAGSVISASGLVGRALAPVNVDAAADYTANYQNDIDTTVFRTVWWAAIWQEVHKSVSLAMWGFGYGYPLGELVPYLKDQFIQTPHNVFFYALAYGGWVGVVVFFWFLSVLGRLVLAIPDARFRHFAVAVFAALVAYAMFEPYFEAPYGAVPFFLVMGTAVGPAILTPRRGALVPARASPSGSGEIIRA